MMDFSARQIAHFLAVLDSSSFLKASQRAHISQPALSKSVKTLEERLGVPLFERLPRGVRPTRHGFAFERYARRLLADTQRTRNELQDISAGACGRIVAGIGSPYVEVARDGLRDFRKEYPNARIEVLTGSAGQLGRLLIEGKVDFVLAMYNGIRQEDQREELSFDHWVTDSFIGICPPCHSVQNRVNDPTELFGYEWCMPLVEQSAMSALRSTFMSAGVRFPTASITTDSIDLLRDMVLQQSMLSILPVFLATGHEFSAMGQFRINGFDFRRNIGIVRRCDFVVSSIHAHFISCIHDHFAAVAAQRCI